MAWININPLSSPFDGLRAKYQASLEMAETAGNGQWRGFLTRTTIFTGRRASIPILVRVASLPCGWLPGRPR
jgi:hypothetical protein